MVIKRENDYKIKFKIADRVCRKQIQELTSLRNIVKELEHFREYVRKRCPELFSQAELFNFEYTDKEA